MSFYSDEVERIEDAELILMGVQPSEIMGMSLQMRADLLEIYAAREAIKAGKLYGS